METTPPASWDHLVKSCGGGFFHYPAATAVSFPSGRPIFITARSGNLVAVALGVLRPCRVGWGSQHAYFATPPAISDSASESDALVLDIVRSLRSRGVAEVTMDSFGGGWVARGLRGSSTLRERREYTISLQRKDADILASFSSSHRRNARRGEKEGWILEKYEGREAVERLYAVQRSAATKGGEEEPRFDVSELRSEALNFLRPLKSFGGLAVYGACSEGKLLSAILLGWANGRAFYLQGGSTAEGYDRYAAVWMHWRLMCGLREAGIHTYNLGGTPAGAIEPDHAQHGLHTFKSRFGSQEMLCRGARWDLAPFHLGAHRTIDAIRRGLSRVVGDRGT